MYHEHNKGTAFWSNCWLWQPAAYFWVKYSDFGQQRNRTNRTCKLPGESQLEVVKKKSFKDSHRIALLYLFFLPSLSNLRSEELLFSSVRSRKLTEVGFGGRRLASRSKGVAFAISLDGDWKKPFALLQVGKAILYHYHSET